MHGRTLLQELVHVPLILVGPGTPRGERLQGPASLVDLMPTILGRLRVPVPEGLEGVDLAPFWMTGEGVPRDRRIFGEADMWFSQKRGNQRRSIRMGRYKLTWDKDTDARELFDLEADPGELENIVEREPELVERLWRDLDAFMKNERDVVESLEMSEEARKELEALGYF